MYRIISVLSMLVLAVSTANESDLLPTHLCGRYLAEALRIACNGVFNGWSKKSHTDDVSPIDLDDNYWQSSEEDQNEVLPWPWHRRSAALQMRNQRHKRQGVSNECCDKRCSFNELRTYCAY